MRQIEDQENRKLSSNMDIAQFNILDSPLATNPDQPTDIDTNMGKDSDYNAFHTN